MRIHVHVAHKFLFRGSFPADMPYCPKVFVVRDQQLWDSTALLLAFMQKCCTVPIVFDKISKKSWTVPICWAFGHQQASQVPKDHCWFFWDSTAFLLSLIVFWGKCRTFAISVADTLYSPKVFVVGDTKLWDSIYTLALLSEKYVGK